MRSLIPILVWLLVIPSCAKTKKVDHAAELDEALRTAFAKPIEEDLREVGLSPDQDWRVEYLIRITEKVRTRKTPAVSPVIARELIRGWDFSRIFCDRALADELTARSKILCGLAARFEIALEGLVAHSRGDVSEVTFRNLMHWCKHCRGPRRDQVVGWLRRLAKTENPIPRKKRLETFLSGRAP